MVIVIYFVFVLLVGLWVSSIHFIEMKNTFTFTIIMITITIFSSLSSSSYISGLMAIEEKQCRRILPRIAVDALDARWCESLCFKHWVGGFFMCGVINTTMTITIIIFTIVIIIIIIITIINNITVLATSSAWPAQQRRLASASLALSSQ